MAAQARAEKKSWASPLSLTLDEIWSRRGKPVVVLATGDPMHFGIGVALAKRVPAEEMAVHPHISAFSLAAARMRWPLADTECLTIHGRPLDLLAGAVAPGRRLLLLSHDGTSPAEVALRLTELGYGASEVTVLEHMGGARERTLCGPRRRLGASACCRSQHAGGLVPCERGGAAPIAVVRLARRGVPA